MCPYLLVSCRPFRTLVLELVVLGLTPEATTCRHFVAEKSKVSTFGLNSP